MRLRPSAGRQATNDTPTATPNVEGYAPLQGHAAPALSSAVTPCSAPLRDVSHPRSKPQGSVRALSGWMLLAVIQSPAMLAAKRRDFDTVKCCIIKISIATDHPRCKGN